MVVWVNNSNLVGQNGMEKKKTPSSNFKTRGRRTASPSGGGGQKRKRIKIKKGLVLTRTLAQRYFKLPPARVVRVSSGTYLVKKHYNGLHDQHPVGGLNLK